MPSRPWTLPLALAALLTTAACGADPEPSAGPTGASPAGGTPASRPTTDDSASPSATSGGPGATESVRPASGVTPIQVVVGGRTFNAELYDNPTADDLADQLPVTVTLADLHGLEKTGTLPRPLTTEGVPRGSDPEINEIGYYAPGRDLVFYYGDVGYFDGIIRIGRFTSNIDSIAHEDDGFSATVERA